MPSLNKCVIGLFALLSMCSLQRAHAVTKVFFVGGQSNATASYKAGIQSVLEATYDDVLVVYKNHPGQPSKLWLDDATDNYYDYDFFNDSGTGILQTALTNLENSGTDYDFMGLFWFQGESDWKVPTAWDDNFLSMIGSLQSDLGDSDWMSIITAVDVITDYNGVEGYVETTQAEVDGMEELRGYMFDLADNQSDVIIVDSRGYDRYDKYHLVLPAVGTQFGVDSANAYVSAVPEPEAFQLWLGSLLALTVMGLRSRRKKICLGS